MIKEADFKKISVFSSAFLLLIAGVFLHAIYLGGNQEDSANVLGASTVEIPEEKKEFVDPFQNIQIEAGSAFVWDISEQKVLYAKNSREVRPIASVTKVMTALTALDILPDYTVIEIEREFLEAHGDTGLFLYERWNLKDLLNFSLLVSSNDAVRAAASVAGAFASPYGVLNHSEGVEVFVSRMNAKAREIGLLNTRFYNESGLDENFNQGGAYSNAEETALLFEYILLNHPEVFEVTNRSEVVFNSLSNLTHVASNTNVSVNDIPGVIASKTGYTELAGGNLVVIFDPTIGRPIAISVLGSILEGRFEYMKKLTEAARRYLER
jgi:D-alanyl-D-alanine carboxypeptidase